MLQPKAEAFSLCISYLICILSGQTFFDDDSDLSFPDGSESKKRREIITGRAVSYVRQKFTHGRSFPFERTR